MKKRYSEEQIIKFLKEADGGVAVKELCRRHGFSETSYYLWRVKFGWIEVSGAKRLKALEAENARLKKLLAESMVENEVTLEALRKKGGDRTGKTRTDAVDARHGVVAASGLRIVCMSASALRYRPRPNQNTYVESFNRRLRDEYLNEHWFVSLAHAKTEIERWRREYNEERPKA